MPIGADKPIRVDVRVITATHRDLAAMVKAGRFRADLYYRLSVVPIEIPTLREISSDIPRIARHLCKQLQLSCRLSEAALQVLQRYSWPGNVRELRNVLERAAVQQERETETLIAALLGIFEPMLILVMGGVVLVIVLAILLPIFDLNQLVR